MIPLSSGFLRRDNYLSALENHFFSPFWQEHVVRFVVKLLSPPIPPSHTGPGSHLVDYMSMLSALLFGASSIDTVHILSLHGAVSKFVFLFPCLRM